MGIEVVLRSKQVLTCGEGLLAAFLLELKTPAKAGSKGESKITSRYTIAKKRNP